MRFQGAILDVHISRNGVRPAVPNTGPTPPISWISCLESNRRSIHTNTEMLRMCADPWAQPSSATFHVALEGEDAHGPRAGPGHSHGALARDHGYPRRRTASARPRRMPGKAAGPWVRWGGGGVGTFVSLAMTPLSVHLRPTATKCTRNVGPPRRMAHCSSGYCRVGTPGKFGDVCDRTHSRIFVF